VDRLVAANPKITVRAQSVIVWGLYAEGKRSATIKRLGLGRVRQQLQG